jgi:hypothetical protein
MIPYSINVQRSENTGSRRHAQAARHSLNMVARKHLFHTLGEHFREGPKTAPGGAYGYVKRRDSYLERKKKKQGHKRPLVFTGQLMRHVRNNSQVTATQDRSVIRLKSPHVLRTQQWRELTATAEDEQREYQQLAATEYSKFLSKNKSPKTRKKIT